MSDSNTDLHDTASQEARGRGEDHVNLIVNGRPRRVDDRVLAYEEVVRLAFPDAQFNENTVYTVDYINGPRENREGSLVAGQQVHVRSGMRFNVTCTDKS